MEWHQLDYRPRSGAHHRRCNCTTASANVVNLGGTPTNSVIGAGFNIGFANGTAEGDVILWDNTAGEWVIDQPAPAVQARNGLNVNAGFVELGGPLIRNTNVDMATFAMEFNGDGQAGGPGVLVDNTNARLRMV